MHVSVVVFFSCIADGLLKERQNHYSSLFPVCNAMMDDHIALCVRRQKEGAGEHTLPFFRIERFVHART